MCLPLHISWEDLDVIWMYMYIESMLSMFPLLYTYYNNYVILILKHYVKYEIVFHIYLDHKV